jgi:hypothetical protein
MDITEEMQEIEEEDVSPIIRIFERLTFERGHDVHDQVSSMIELFSLSNASYFSIKIFFFQILFIR